MARAQENPDINFLGFDRVVKWMKKRIVQSEKLPNLKFMKAEAGEFLKSVPLESVKDFHVYFPDPWPKRRHQGRRFINELSLLTLYERLVPGGSIYLATDHADYYVQMQKSAALLKVPCAMTESRERMAGPVQTNYEMKFAAQGLPLYYMRILKPEKPS